MKPEIRFKSRMEADKLIIDGKCYGTDNLDKLPQTIEFFLNGAELLLNSVNSEKLINH